ncbi:hypothetical protein Taro_009905 [Colocasia esculenta]|uniref:Uncharacterized protein n=1 Tax=Colocasia esculenta TaxID=4460 RepID=A0A843U1I9_COLES|nr:hypothetical protein [Colocasia esculenta]
MICMQLGSRIQNTSKKTKKSSSKEKQSEIVEDTEEQFEPARYSESDSRSVTPRTVKPPPSLRRTVSGIYMTERANVVARDDLAIEKMKQIYVRRTPREKGLHTKMQEVAQPSEPTENKRVKTARRVWFLILLRIMMMMILVQLQVLLLAMAHIHRSQDNYGHDSQGDYGHSSQGLGYYGHDSQGHYGHDSQGHYGHISGYGPSGGGQQETRMYRPAETDTESVSVVLRPVENGQTSELVAEPKLLLECQEGEQLKIQDQSPLQEVVHILQVEQVEPAVKLAPLHADPQAMPPRKLGVSAINPELSVFDKSPSEKGSKFLSSSSVSIRLEVEEFKESKDIE